MIPATPETRLISQAMQDSDNWVIEMTYVDTKGHETRRVVSPMKYIDDHKFIALCLAREEPRHFKIAKCRDIELQPAAEYLMPNREQRMRSKTIGTIRLIDAMDGMTPCCGFRIMLTGGRAFADSQTWFRKEGRAKTNRTAALWQAMLAIRAAGYDGMVRVQHRTDKDREARVFVPKHSPSTSEKRAGLYPRFDELEFT